MPCVAAIKFRMSVYLQNKDILFIFVFISDLFLFHQNFFLELSLYGHIIVTVILVSIVVIFKKNKKLDAVT